MRRGASLTTFVLLVALLGGCGGDSNGDDSAASPTPGAAATEAPTREPGKGEKKGDEKQGGGKKRDAPKVQEPTKAEHERSRQSARVFAECLRDIGAKASTQSNSPKSRIIKLGKGVVLRVTWEEGADEGADVYVGTADNARRVARALKRKPDVFKRRVLVLYDSKPTRKQTEMVRHCASRENL